jgi:glycosyltransferase involved in cell wall biosynthesis
LDEPENSSGDLEASAAMSDKTTSNPPTALPSYVLVTPARNEQELIEGAIRSVVAQTHRPLRWMIVSDGSTDRTDQIVAEYAKKHDWIELFRMPEHRDRTFAAKATCFNAGYERLRGRTFDLVGNLDADITFGADYYERLVGEFAANPRLGVGGTPFVEDASRPDAHSYDHDISDKEHVSGACQMFRRECFDDIGGYVPIRGGGIDWVAVTTARMRGWQTRTFTDTVCFHHRKMGTAERGPLMARFRHGHEDYVLGGHPLWELLRSMFQMRRRPLVLGGVFLLSGYLWAAMRRAPRVVSAELMAFHRGEQMDRIRSLIRR